MAEDKLKDFARRLEQSRKAQQGGETSRSEEGSALSLAARAVTELVVGLLVAMGLGWLLDRYLGTQPWFMLLFLPLGLAAGILNVMRLGRSKQAEELLGGNGTQQPAPPATDEDED
jgi:ATP synthase protein I